MKTSDKFTEITSYQEEKFTELFGEVDFVSKTTQLSSTKLGKYMNNKEIIDELKPTEVTLGEVYSCLETLDHSISALFYCRDKNDELNMVSATWKEGWIVRTFIFEVDSEWRWRGDNYLFSKL